MLFACLFVFMLACLFSCLFVCLIFDCFCLLGHLFNCLVASDKQRNPSACSELSVGSDRSSLRYFDSALQQKTKNTRAVYIFLECERESGESAAGAGDGFWKSCLGKFTPALRLCFDYHLSFSIHACNMIVNHEDFETIDGVDGG